MPVTPALHRLHNMSHDASSIRNVRFSSRREGQSPPTVRAQSRIPSQLRGYVSGSRSTKTILGGLYLNAYDDVSATYARRLHPRLDNKQRALDAQSHTVYTTKVSAVTLTVRHAINVEVGHWRCECVRISSSLLARRKCKPIIDRRPRVDL